MFSGDACSALVFYFVLAHLVSRRGDVFRYCLASGSNHLAARKKSKNYRLTSFCYFGIAIRAIVIATKWNVHRVIPIHIFISESSKSNAPTPAIFIDLRSARMSRVTTSYNSSAHVAAGAFSLRHSRAWLKGEPARRPRERIWRDTITLFIRRWYFHQFI